MPGPVLNRVSEFCGRKRWTVTDLARECHISYPTAHNLYHDKAKAISFQVMGKLAAGIGVPIGDLFVYTPNGDPD
jgi:putative transcriptional regulator